MRRNYFQIVLKMVKSKNQLHFLVVRAFKKNNLKLFKSYRMFIVPNHSDCGSEKCRSQRNFDCRIKMNLPKIISFVDKHKVCTR